MTSFWKYKVHAEPGFLLAWASNKSGVVDDCNFLAISVTTSSETSEIGEQYYMTICHALSA